MCTYIKYCSVTWCLLDKMGDMTFQTFQLLSIHAVTGSFDKTAARSVPCACVDILDVMCICVVFVLCLLKVHKVGDNKLVGYQ